MVDGFSPAEEYLRELRVSTFAIFRAGPTKRGREIKLPFRVQHSIYAMLWFLCTVPGSARIRGLDTRVVMGGGVGGRRHPRHGVGSRAAGPGHPSHDSEAR